MLGAMLGDLVGSPYESRGLFAPSPQTIDLWPILAEYTDDTVLTAAVARWCLDGGDLAPLLHEFGNAHLHRGYGGRFIEWLLADTPPPPYGSWGNGSAMRVSPVALWADSLNEVEDLAAQSALPTHDHPKGIRGAQVAAWATRHALEHQDRRALARDVETRFGYPIRAFDPLAVRAEGFQIECEATVLAALWCAICGQTWEGSLRLVLALGGDTDTLGAIAGAIAEGLYGVPPHGLEQLGLRFTRPNRIWPTLSEFYHHPKVAARLKAWNRWPEGSWSIPVD